MNYRHAYHAGNFADVFKHLILQLLLEHLKQKPTPFCCIDTHAGSGVYDLHEPTTQKTREYTTGIERLYHATSLPPEIQQYVNTLQLFNPKGILRYYLGSPALLAHHLRPQDQGFCIESHPAVFEELKYAIGQNPHIHLLAQEGYQTLKALLPPKQKRGLVFIDPPYEDLTEYEQILFHLKVAYPRWTTGIFSIWYPIKNRLEIQHFWREIKKLGIKKILATEICLYPDDNPKHLNGCGMLLINPPWQLDKRLPLLLQYLIEKLSEHSARKYTVTWLVEE